MHARITGHRTWLALAAGLGLAAPTAAQLSESLFHDPAYLVDDGPGDATVADLDGDARTDLVVSCAGGHTIRVLLGAGDGSFPNGMSFDVPDAGPIAMADFNEDGELDVATGFGSNLISLLLGDGAGNFAPGPPIVLQESPWALAQADFDSDGHADLVTTHTYDSFAPGSVEVLMGKGDATFVSQSTTAVGHGPVSIAVADFDTDDQADLAVVNIGDATLSILLGQGDGSFTSLSPLFMGGGGGASGPAWLAVGDFTEDGQPDLGVCCFAESVFTGVTILVAVGDGSVVKHAFYIVHGPFAVDDFNEDGRVDLACSSNYVGAGTIMLGEGDGDFVEDSHFSNGTPAGGWNPALVSADFDGDGRLDLATCNGSEDRVAIRFGKGDGTFPSVLNQSGYTGDEAKSVATGDLDADGLQDAVVANTKPKWVTTYLGQADGGLEQFGTFAIAQQPSAVALADFDGDGQLDAVTTDQNSDKVSILLGPGTGGLALQSSFAVGDEPLSVAIGDFNEDGRADVVTGNHGGNSVSVLLGHGSGGLGVGGTFPAGLDPIFVAVGDFDGDASQDLAVVNDADTLTILTGNGVGSFVVEDSLPVAAGATSLAVADIDADGWQDLVVGHDAGTTVTLLLGSASGFVAGEPVTAGTRPLAVAVSDLDGDGTVDVAAANAASATVSVLLGAGDGTFQLNGHFVCTQNSDESRALAIADFDNDARPDLVVLGELPYAPVATIAVLMNKGPSAWTDLGKALSGSVGEPSLTGSGPLGAASSNSLLLTYAKHFAVANIVVGFDEIDAPVKGGILVPVPHMIMVLPTGPAGAVDLDFVLPPVVPPGITMYFQTWIPDSQAISGWAASNGLLGTTP